MSRKVKVVLAIGLVAFVGACAAKTETVYVEPTPIAAEPVYSKY